MYKILSGSVGGVAEHRTKTFWCVFIGSQCSSVVYLLQAVHPFLATGIAKSKFGIDESQLDDVLDIIANESQLLKLVGLHCHLGSTIDNVVVFRSVQRQRIDSDVKSLTQPMSQASIGKLRT